MAEFLRLHQLSIMLALSGICFTVAVFVAITNTLPKKRKFTLLYMELCSGLLLVADRYAYIFRGNTTDMGYVMVRITNFFVFFLSLSVMHAFNLYLDDLLASADEGRSPLGLKIARALIYFGQIMVVISQFTGFYYRFDSKNRYVRGKGFLISYVVPVLVLLIQLVVIWLHRKTFRKRILIPEVLFSALPVAAAIVQIFTYGLSLTNMSIVFLAVTLYVFVLWDVNDTVKKANDLEVKYLKKERRKMRSLFTQTASALATAIDAKDAYTQGHSGRVAKYARKIAERYGKSEDECDEVYYAALLHDIGKIGTPDGILNKKTGLTSEEKDIAREHPAVGGKILEAIDEFPYLALGAKYHHERYDGNGYPEGLKGKNIPEIARIVAVADVYDAMTSKRSYSVILPQSTVREEMLKASGTQLDPEFVKIMIGLIDEDKNYNMRQSDEYDIKKKSLDLNIVSVISFGDYKKTASDGLQLDNEIITLEFDSEADPEADASVSVPSLVLFDCMDGCVHQDPTRVERLKYTEYGEIWFDGHATDTAARDIKVSEAESVASAERYRVTAVKYKDHVQLTTEHAGKKFTFTVALPYSTSYAYLAVTGEHCRVFNINLKSTGQVIDENFIPRIAEETNYINRISGDMANVQIEESRSVYTESVKLFDGLKMRFHTMSLPTASLAWHCPYILLFTAKDGKVNGEGYDEFALMRLDGEDLSDNPHAMSSIVTTTGDQFMGWDAWKESNKRGYDTEVRFKRRKNKITITTKNHGIDIKDVVTVDSDVSDIYVCLTGCQCALTDIRYRQI